MACKNCVTYKYELMSAKIKEIEFNHRTFVTNNGFMGCDKIKSYYDMASDHVISMMVAVMNEKCPDCDEE